MKVIFRCLSLLHSKVFSESYDSKVNSNFWALSSQERKLTFALARILCAFSCRVSPACLLWCVLSDHIPLTAVYPFTLQEIVLNL